MTIRTINRLTDLTGTGERRAVLQLAVKLDRAMQAAYQAHLDECASYLRDGYRPHFCEHGSSDWTDYDNICGPCEDGLTNGDGVQRRRRALDEAFTRWEKVDALIVAYQLLGKAVGQHRVGELLDQKVWGKALADLANA